ncbi:MAG: 1-acyl-sn-glycerol-3-phosphate acyltransferase [Acidobacteria bacterium]|nr:1-acyl-sn-glycerol-3-phosphate acyltransferase [Acidobacteriota bacterium]MCA1612189.1 1-acyl-sn-glycerol-3-phosphate acyltransferase [Acidobacteriota bacterium]
MERVDAAKARAARLRALLERLAFFLGFLAGGIWFFLCSAAGLLALLVTHGSRNNVFLFARFFCGGVVRLMGWRIDVDAAKLSGSRPCVFVSNHQSIMDLLVYGAIVPRRTVAVGKREISKIPLFGWFFRASGNLVIERGNSEAAREMLAAAARRLKEEGVSVWFMPEGTRNAGRELLPFKTGAFRLAAAAGVPVVPVVAAPLDAIVDTERFRSRRGRLAVRVLGPITVGGEEEAIAAAARETRDRMQRELEALISESPAR